MRTSGSRATAQQAAEAAVAATNAGLNIHPQPVAMPDFLARLPDGGRRWQVVCLETAQPFGPYTEIPTQAMLEAIDAGNGYRYEIVQEELTKTGRGWLRAGHPKIYTATPPKPVTPPPPAPGDFNAQTLFALATGMADLKSAIVHGGGRNQPGPWASGFAPNGEAMVPRSSIEAEQARADKRISDAETACNRRIEAAERDNQRAMKAAEDLHDTRVQMLKDRITEAERANTRLESEMDRLRDKLNGSEDARDELDGELRKANRTAADLEAELEAAKARAVFYPAGAAIPGAPTTPASELDELERLHKGTSKFAKVAELMGYEKAGAAAPSGEPLEIQRLNTYMSIAKTAAETGVDLLKEWRKDQGPATTATTTPAQAATPGAQAGMKLLVALLDGHYRSGQEPQAALAAMLPMVPMEHRAGLAATPTPQFATDVQGLSPANSPLRSPQGRAWIESLHGLMAGRVALPAPPQQIAAPAFRPLVPPSAPAAQFPPPQMPAVATNPDGGVRFADKVAQMQREAAEAAANANGGGLPS